MHIPDTFLNVPVLVSTNIISLGGLSVSLRKLKKDFSPEKIPLMGLAASFVFTIQMLSFPVPGGTSVHISGALLISLILGPFSGVIIASSALILQAVLFQHGGALTLGANILNIAIIQCGLGILIYKMIPAKSKPIKISLAVISSKLLSSLACATELFLSGTLPLGVGIIVMAASHFIAGIIEAMVTVSVIRLIMKIRPSLMAMKKI